MNKDILISIIGTILVCTLILIKVTVHKNGKLSKELVLTYKMSAGIPFKRIFEIEDESVVEFVQSYIIKDENKGGIVGAPIYTNYVFKGLKEGSTTITFKEISITDDSDIVTEEKTNVHVDKDLNISIVVDK